MSLLTLKRGVKLRKNKLITKNAQIITLKPADGELLCFPMLQHLGVPATPVVEKGQRVLMGEKLGEADAKISAHVFASVSGTVMAVTPLEVIIENDGLFEEITYTAYKEDYLSLDRAKYIEIIKQAGLVGLGGAGFPTHVKLDPPKPSDIDTIIINGAECEPYLTTDYKTMLTKSEQIMRGIHILLKMFDSAKIVMAIEKDKPDIIKLYQDLAKTDSISKGKLSIKALQPTYPQGSEKQLIQSVAGRQVPSGELPLSVGCMVLNVTNLVWIDTAVTEGRPLTKRIITLSGGAIKNKGNYEVHLGMSLQSLIDAAGGFNEDDLSPVKLIAGGPMMGKAMFDLSRPAVKTNGGILALTEQEAALPEEEPCIRCSRCVEYCPIGLLPFELNQLALAGDYEGFKKLNGLDCIECGACSYICPSKRHLAQSIILAKKTILDADKKEVTTPEKEKVGVGK